MLWSGVKFTVMVRVSHLEVTAAPLEDFVELVVPVLQERGVFRAEYEEATSHEILGLPRLASRFGPAL